eukprot:s3663_g7.t1
MLPPPPPLEQPSSAAGSADPANVKANTSRMESEGEEQEADPPVPFEHGAMVQPPPAWAAKRLGAPQPPKMAPVVVPPKRTVEPDSQRLQRATQAFLAALAAVDASQPHVVEPVPRAIEDAPGMMTAEDYNPPEDDEEGSGPHTSDAEADEETHPRFNAFGGNNEGWGDYRFVEGELKVSRGVSTLQTDSEFAIHVKWEELGGSESAAAYLNMDQITDDALWQSCSREEESKAQEECSKHLGEIHGSADETFYNDCIYDVCHGAGETAAELAAELLASTRAIESI